MGLIGCIMLGNLDGVEELGELDNLVELDEFIKLNESGALDDLEEWV